MRQLLSSELRLVLTITLALLAPRALLADININFQSVFEANNTKSDGSPMDVSFTFEFGTFSDEFMPLQTNTSEWMTHWVATPNSNESVFSGPTVPYSTDNVPFGGPANAFQGFVTLNTNDEPFASDKQGYFWGYTERETPGYAEWVLLSNPSWLYPTVIPGELEAAEENWLMSDGGTYTVIGSVNPAYDTALPASSQQPHMSSSLVDIPPAPVPEPGASVLVLLSLPLVAARRRPI